MGNSSKKYDPEGSREERRLYVQETDNIYDANFLNSLLLERGVCVNTRNTRGNTLLHYSVILRRIDVFHSLLNQKSTKLDQVNSNGHSALILSLINNQTDYAVKLIKRGANINLVDKIGYTPLHYAIIHNSDEFCNFLLENQPDLNAQNIQGETPLHLACRPCFQLEKIYMLLCYGADALISCDNGIIPLFLVMQNCTTFPDLYEVLFNYTVHEEGTAIDLKVLGQAMMMDKPIFFTLIETATEVVYNESDLELLNDWLPSIPLIRFKLLFEKFDHVIRDLFLNCCTLTHFLITNEHSRRVPPDFVYFLEFLLESHLAYELVQSSCPSISVISSLVKIFHKNDLPLSKLTQLTCIMLSHGANVTPNDFNAVYVYYGRCELFDILLHMDTEKIVDRFGCCTIYEYEVVPESIMAHLFYDIELTIDKFLARPKWFLAKDLDVLLDYFAKPELKDFFLFGCFTKNNVQERVRKMPAIPYLIELARNAARNFIIERFNIKNCRQFYTVVKWQLPIADEHKKILCYERKLYDA